MEVFQSGKSLKRPSTAESKEDGSAKKAKVLQHPVRSVSDSASVADKLRLERRRLPIFWGRRTLLDEVFKNENVIIMSETGSGKTTQIPQYVLEAGLAKKGIIACTQPRRVAAITVAQRVAKEKRGETGDLVGYCVRFEDVTSERTKIKYMTDGMLLREALGDPLLEKYSIIILDEAHERTIHTDVLFGVVKSAQKKRKENGMSSLKIIIMSATLEAEHFAKYFNDAKILYLEGRRHPIKIMYTSEPQPDYVHAALVSVLQLHQEMPPGQDILVFLTGQEEIEALGKLIRDCAQNLNDDSPKLMVCPLFAALPSSQQMNTFAPAPAGHRKVILATNIAETSITIPGVKYVIDTGMVKAKGYDPRTGLDMLIVQPVSKAQARQRCGRAGRECPGVCYRLYTEDSFKNLVETSTPEIQRSNLSGVILQLLALEIADVLSFDFMDAPSLDAMNDALSQLELLGAIESRDNPKAVTVQVVQPHKVRKAATVQAAGNYQFRDKLTVIGRKMAAFPLDPRLSKCILASLDLKCSEEILTIVALLSVESIVYNPSDKREEARSIRRKFLSPEGDQITLLKIFRAHRHAKGSHEWCQEHFVNFRAMRTVLQIRKQLRDLCIKHNIPIISCGKDFTPVRRALAAGMFTNSAELQRDGAFFTIGQRQIVEIHPSSALFHTKPSYVIFNELVKTSKCYMRNICVVDPQWLVEACPRYFKQHKIQLKAVSS